MLDDLGFDEGVFVPTSDAFRYLVARDRYSLLSKCINKSAECMTSCFCLLLILGIYLDCNGIYLHFLN